MKIVFERDKSAKKGIKEFSKRVIVCMTVAWFVGLCVGVFAVIWQTVRGDMVSLGDLLMYIGAPMTGGIVSYMIKSAEENKIKIKKSEVNHEKSCEEADQP